MNKRLPNESPQWPTATLSRSPTLPGPPEFTCHVSFHTGVHLNHDPSLSILATNPKPRVTTAQPLCCPHPLQCAVPRLHGTYFSSFRGNSWAPNLMRSLRQSLTATSHCLISSQHFHCLISALLFTLFFFIDSLHPEHLNPQMPSAFSTSTSQGIKECLVCDICSHAQ